MRAQVAERDGYCRLSRTQIFGGCSGRSEWSHFGDHRRGRTMGQAPERRHTKAGTLMLCSRHHQLYDGHRIEIEARTPSECEGDLCFRSSGRTYYEGELS